MAATLLGGAALGPVFDTLLKAVLNVGINIATFRSQFLSLKQTLLDIEPVFADIHKLSKALNGRDEEIDMFKKLLMEGEALVRKCSKTKSYDAFKKWDYSRKLTKLENSLVRFCQIHGLIQVCRDTKTILVKVNEHLAKVNEHGKKLDEIHSMLRYISLTGSRVGFTNSDGSDVPQVPDSVVGFEVPLQELKFKVLEEKDPGCGKTTFAAKVCQEDDIKESEPNLGEDEALAKALQESLNMEPPPPPPPRYDYGSLFPPVSCSFPYGHRVCAGCNGEIGHGRYLSCMGAVWHPECFRCQACNQPISDYEFSMSDNRPYHKSCYKEQHHPKCDVCKSFIPTNSAGLIEYRAHPFWLQKYCPSHENDGTPRCCSCERMEPVDARYLILDDGRKLCLECCDSVIMDTGECQPLYLEIQEFYEGLNMKVEQQIPLLLVERQALNEAMEGEKHGHHHMPETRGLCLSEEQTISTISRRPRIGGYRILDMFTEPYRLIRRCEVTAILILYGLPRLLTGSILAHEMMHAWLRLKGYSSLSPEVEEGICQVLAHMWLGSEIIAGSGSSSTSASSSASSSSSSSSSNSSKKWKRSDFEKKLGDFFKHQIESDTSATYGDGFREGNKAVLNYGLKRTLDHMRLTGTFPC